MLEAIRAAGGEVYGITSEPHSLASEAEAAWDLSMPIIGDPHHEIRKDLAARGWIDIFFNEDFGHLRNRSWASHPNGYYQPAVLAADRSGRVLYRWRCVPKYSNMSGAGGRPEAQYTWDKVQAARSDDGVEPVLDQTPEMGAPTVSWPMFLLILFAHGWFLRPKAFPLMRDGGKDKVTPPQALRRAAIFAGCWVLAFLFFPAVWVGAVFAVWLLLLIPGMIEIHRQFQNEPDAY